MKTISLKLPDDLAARLERAASQGGRTKSDLIRDALRAYFEMKSNGRRGRVSALDLAGHLAGCLEGPEDLATNPAHMEGFGK